LTKFWKIDKAFLINIVKLLIAGVLSIFGLFILEEVVWKHFNHPLRLPYNTPLFISFIFVVVLLFFKKSLPSIIRNALILYVLFMAMEYVLFSFIGVPCDPNFANYFIFPEWIITVIFGIFIVLGLWLIRNKEPGQPGLLEFFIVLVILEVLMFLWLNV